MVGAPIVLEGVSHSFREGKLRTQVLFDISAEIRAGEIVIIKGPSGSGKTTLLTLIGALRSCQEGSLRVLGNELRGASETVLTEVRRNIGYVFQAHNLLAALSALRNVEMSLQLHADIPPNDRRRRATQAIEAVGLGHRLGHYPDQLSGGERLRVAVARALAGDPRIILADEPTASLDKESGRAVVERLRRLAKDRGVTVVMVTHDNRILDVADRIVACEDGRLLPLNEAMASDSERMMCTLAQDLRQGLLTRRGAFERIGEFEEFLGTVTEETRRFLDVVEKSQGAAYEGLLTQVIGGFSTRVGAILGAEHASLSLLDGDEDELRSWTMQPGTREVVETRTPADQGISGRVATSGEAYRAAGVLSVPVRDARGRVLGVAQLESAHRSFTEGDERLFTEFAAALAAIIESWSRTCVPFGRRSSSPVGALKCACGPEAGNGQPVSRPPASAGALDPRERELVAVGISVAAGCKPCTAHHLKAARNAGARIEEIERAVAGALEVRRDAAEVMERFVRSRLEEVHAGDDHGEPGGRIHALVGVGAAFAVNCTASLRQHLHSAQTVGVTTHEIGEVLQLGGFIRQQAISHVERPVPVNTGGE